MDKREELRKKLLTSFDGIDAPIKDALADIESPMILGFATLALAESNAGYTTLTATSISEALEAAGVAVSSDRIAKAFAKAGDRISRHEAHGERYFRLMTSGKREVEPYLSIGPLEVTYIEAGKPRKARRFLKDLLGSLKGKIRVSDPYYGRKSLDTLEMIPKKCDVQFLTAHSNESQSKLKAAVSDFKKERQGFELKRYPNKKELHDRYILTDEQLLILGHGIKDIGDRESFVVTISRQLAPDLLANIRDTFDKRWGLSDPP